MCLGGPSIPKPPEPPKLEKPPRRVSEELLARRRGGSAAAGRGLLGTRRSRPGALQPQASTTANLKSVYNLGN